MGHYDTAQICLNGHVITGDIAEKDFMEVHCSECGAETITDCQSCHAPIRGYYDDPGNFGFLNYSPPAFCHNCGAPFPWIQAKLDAAIELIDEMDELNAEEQDKFKTSLPDIMFETPKTELSATRIAKYLRKISPTLRDAFKHTMLGVTLEFAKRLIWPV